MDIPLLPLVLFVLSPAGHATGFAFGVIMGIDIIQLPVTQPFRSDYESLLSVETPIFIVICRVDDCFLLPWRKEECLLYGC